MKTLQGHRRGGEEDVLGCWDRVNNALVRRCRIGNAFECRYGEEGTLACLDRAENALGCWCGTEDANFRANTGIQ